MVVAQLQGLTRMDLPLMMGTVVSVDPDRARFIAFLMHRAMGQVFVFFYAASFALLGFSCGGWACSSVPSTRSWRSRCSRIPPSGTTGGRPPDARKIEHPTGWLSRCAEASGRPCGLAPTFGQVR
jgi:hypothetical protein